MKLHWVQDAVVTTESMCQCIHVSILPSCEDVKFYGRKPDLDVMVQICGGVGFKLSRHFVLKKDKAQFGFLKQNIDEGELDQ